MKEVDKRALQEWQQWIEDLRKETPPERLSALEMAKKKAYLEKHPVEWMQYFFPNYAACPFAPFQKEAISRICRNDEWFEAWSWARELAKSTVAMKRAPTPGRWKSRSISRTLRSVSERE